MANRYKFHPKTFGEVLQISLIPTITTEEARRCEEDRAGLVLVRGVLLLSRQLWVGGREKHPQFCVYLYFCIFRGVEESIHMIENTYL